jgi:hypothetical protein
VIWEDRSLVSFNPAHKAVLDDLLLGDPRVRPGKMFGFPAYYVGRKLCICLYEDGVGVKLPAPAAAGLLRDDPHAIPFQPLGKSKMREWVQIDLPDSQEYRRYLPVFEQSIAYLQVQGEEGAA